MKSFTQFIFEKKNSRKGNTSGTKNTKGSGTGSIGGSEESFVDQGFEDITLNDQNELDLTQPHPLQLILDYK